MKYSLASLLLATTLVSGCASKSFNSSAESPPSFEHHSYQTTLTQACSLEQKKSDAEHQHKEIVAVRLTSPSISPNRTSQAGEKTFSKIGHASLIVLKSLIILFGRCTYYCYSCFC